jgi:non-specific serine/threonine protein kinase/serine/threonine-protein kinase
MRLSTLGEAASVTAESRRTEPGMLTRQIQGELDWITMKALEKDRVRRYGSPSDLAMDIGRYLVDQPVTAGPPGALYRTRKFVRRHRVAVTAATAAMVGLVVFTGIITVQAKQIALERDRANRQAEISKRTEQFLVGLFDVSAPSESRGNSVTAIELLEAGTREIERDLADQPEVREQLMNTVQQAHDQLGIDLSGEGNRDAE